MTAAIAKPPRWPADLPAPTRDGLERRLKEAQQARRDWLKRGGGCEQAAYLAYRIASCKELLAWINWQELKA